MNRLFRTFRVHNVGARNARSWTGEIVSQVESLLREDQKNNFRQSYVLEVTVVPEPDSTLNDIHFPQCRVPCPPSYFASPPKPDES